MPMTAVYYSKCLHVSVSRESLDQLMSGDALICDLSLKDMVFSHNAVLLRINEDGLAILREIVTLERNAMEEYRTQIHKDNPDYSNRKIRKGKGHGKG